MPRPPHASARPPLPRAIVVSGPAGSGKTTLAVALAAKLGYTLADLDIVTGPLIALALERSGAAPDAVDSFAGRRLRAARYAALLDVAEANLAVGNGVVVAAPFTIERSDPVKWSLLVSRLSEHGGGGVGLIFLDVPADVLHRRLSERGAARDHAKLRRAPRSPGAQRLVNAAIVVDGTTTIDEQLSATLRAFGRPADRRSIVLDPSSC